VKLAAGQTSTTLATVATTGSASDITTGTLADGRLSSNVPLLNASNVFTNNNYMSHGLAMSGVYGVAPVANELQVDTVTNIILLEAYGQDTSTRSDVQAYGETSNGAAAWEYWNCTHAQGLCAFPQGITLPQTTPGSSSATCTAGQIWADASYIYACTATNTIKRAALSSF